MADINELERKVNTLWQQDYPNQKKVLDLETQVKVINEKLSVLEKKVNTPLPAAPKVSDEQIKFNKHILSLCESLRKSVDELKNKKVKLSDLRLGNEK